MTPGRRPGWPHVYTFLFLLHLFLCPVDLAGNSAFDTQRPAVGLATDARLCSGVPTASLKPDWEGSALSPQEGVPTGAAPPAAAVKLPLTTSKWLRLTTRSPPVYRLRERSARSEMRLQDCDQIRLRQARGWRERLE